jgi:hypothetical protein
VPGENNLTPVWQKRRSRFNHDWLKNQFLPTLARWLNLLDDLIEDPEFERSFIPTFLAEWESQRVEARSLASQFEVEMSPACLLDHPPLARFSEQDKAWLKRLVHNLWLQRYAVSAQVDEALAAIRDADAIFVAIQQRLDPSAEPPTAADERVHLIQWREFRECCQNLAKVIEAFPNQVKVT